MTTDWNYPLLLKWRVEGRWKHEQVCAATGVSFTYLHKLEKHGGNPSADVLRRLCDFYGHSIAELFADDDDLADAQ